MIGYKIRVNNEAESKEVQELFFELGGRWASCGKSYNDMIEAMDCIFLTENNMLNYGLGIGREEITLPQLRDLVAKRENEQGLIGGAEAHKALLAGENVQYSGDGGEEHWDTALNCNIGVFLNQEKFPNFKFRIVPRTIKIELEIPAPIEGERKNNKAYWCFTEMQGIYWDSEEKFKQVVAALRGALK